MVARAGLPNEDMEFVQFHPTGNDHAISKDMKKSSHLWFKVYLL